MLGARDPSVFEHFDVNRAPGFERLLASVRATVPRGSTVLVISKGDGELLKLGRRCGWHFPQDEDGAWAGYHPVDSAAAIAHLEDLRAEGADYLVIPEAAFWWLEYYEEFRQHLENSYPMRAGEEKSCLIFALRSPNAAPGAPPASPRPFL